MYFFHKKKSDNILLYYHYLFCLNNKWNSSLNRKYSTSNGADRKDQKIGFYSHSTSCGWNHKITDKDVFSFFENELNIYEFMISNQVSSTISFYSVSPDLKINGDCLSVRKWKNCDQLYIIDIFNDNETFCESWKDGYYFYYFFYRKKINVYLSNQYYTIYCIYYLIHNYSFSSSFTEIEYKCAYIYFDVSNNTFKFSQDSDSNINHFLSEKEEKCSSHESDIFLYNSLIDAISDLVSYDIIKIPLEFQKSFDSIRKKNKIFSNTIRKFYINKVTHFHKNNFFSTKIKLGSILDTNIQISGVFRLKYFSKDLFNKYFHSNFLTDVSQFWMHRWVVFNNINIVDEDGHYRNGFILSSITSHTGKGEISLFCPSFLNNKSRLFYYGFYFDSYSDIKTQYINVVKGDTENINFTFAHHYIVNALPREMIELRCVYSNKKVYVLDNINLSTLDVNKIYMNKKYLTDFSSLYCNKYGQLIDKKQLLLTTYEESYSETKVSFLNKNTIDHRTYSKEIYFIEEEDYVEEIYDV